MNERTEETTAKAETKDVAKVVAYVLVDGELYEICFSERTTAQ